MLCRNDALSMHTRFLSNSSVVKEDIIFQKKREGLTSVPPPFTQTVKNHSQLSEKMIAFPTIYS